MKYIIVQAGGRGTRLGYLTKNKPKALTPVENLPMLFHLFKKYSDKRFVIIADYKKDVLRRYLAEFSNVKYQIVNADGRGTCSGVAQAISLIPEQEPFMLVWSDLILSDRFMLPEEYSDNSQKSLLPTVDYVGISTTFSCRWKYENGEFAEERSTEHGVAGFFLFREKRILKDVPKSGEFVRWIKEKQLFFEPISLEGTREFGLLEEYEKLEQMKTRPFNRIIVHNNILIKEPVDEQGFQLAERECAWYKKAKEYNITGIPQIYATNPLKMEFIKGKNIYECNFPYEAKRRILRNIVIKLKELHIAGSIPADSFSIKESYFNKTLQRLSKIEYLVPFAREKYVRVNGKNCRNVFFYKEQLEKKLEALKTDIFCFIHGDCTFSNLIIKENEEVVLIDPRGYFGYTELYGDERYDWAKLYYSMIGNYDQFNLKKFDLTIPDNMEEGITLNIESNGWELLEEEFFELTGADKFEIKFLHAIVWLSLTTYAWQDYDSICGAFYNGLYYLEEVL